MPAILPPPGLALLPCRPSAGRYTPTPPPPLNQRRTRLIGTPYSTVDVACVDGHVLDSAATHHPLSIAAIACGRVPGPTASWPGIPAIPGQGSTAHLVSCLSYPPQLHSTARIHGGVNLAMVIFTLHASAAFSPGQHPRSTIPWTARRRAATTRCWPNPRCLAAAVYTLSSCHVAAGRSNLTSGAATTMHSDTATGRRLKVCVL